MDEHKDMATSFKYTVDIESERNTRAKQYQSLSNIKSPRMNAKLPVNAVSDTMENPGPSTPHNRALPQESLSPPGSKGKRKVTFDIKPAVSGGEKRRTEVLEQQGEGQFKALLSAWGHRSDSPVQLRSLIWRMTMPTHIQELPKTD
jgi:hypothetical protein